MKTRKPWLLRMAVLLIAITAAIAAWFLLVEPPPIYQDKSVKEWIKELSYESSGRVAELQTIQTPSGTTNQFFLREFLAIPPPYRAVPEGRPGFLPQLQQPIPYFYGGPTGANLVVNVPIHLNANTGKPPWVEPILIRSQNPGRPSAIEAIQSLEPKAIPFLIEAAERQDTVWSRTYRSCYFKLPLGARSIVPLPPPPASEMRQAALAALGHLGEHAAPAFPVLRQALGSQDWGLRSKAFESLVYIFKSTPELQTPASEVLLAHASNHEIILLTKQLKLSGSRAAQALAKALKDEDPSVSRAAASLLARQGRDARLALPDLIVALGHQDHGLRFFAAQTLEVLGQEAQEAIPALTMALEDENDRVRSAAESALRAIRAALAAPPQGGTGT